MDAFEIADEMLRLLMSMPDERFQSSIWLSLELIRKHKLKANDREIKRAKRILANKGYIDVNNNEFKITIKGIEFINAGGFNIEHRKEELLLKHMELSILSIKNQKRISWITLGIAILTLIVLIVQAIKD